MELINLVLGIFFLPKLLILQFYNLFQINLCCINSLGLILVGYKIVEIYISPIFPNLLVYEYSRYSLMVVRISFHIHIRQEYCNIPLLPLTLFMWVFSFSFVFIGYSSSVWLFFSKNRLFHKSLVLLLKSSFHCYIFPHCFWIFPSTNFEFVFLFF